MRSVRHRVLSGLAFGVCLVVTSALAAACGADADDGALPGAALANEYGCMACHGSEGEGGTGPAWAGLFGSEVTLDDGSVVVADRGYLVRSIVDPDADRPADVVLRMPKNSIPASDIEAIVDYLVSLG